MGVQPLFAEATSLEPGLKTEIGGLNQRYRLALMAYFMRRSASHTDAEDLTQEVFARLATGPFGGVNNPDAYIFQMAANLLRDRGRRERVRTSYSGDFSLNEQVDVEVLDPARYLLSREELGGVIGYIKELPERTQAIFLLFRLENIDQAQLAAHYGISTRAVQKHVQKAMTHIVVRLREAGR